jgi:NAD(P)-dependent dehydrogenase (short-subunit alcohol dehydrogenase family)
MRLAGKVCLITGAGSGIGRATALLFGREGARVAAADIDPGAAEATAAAIREPGGQARALAVDVADGASVRAMLGAVMESEGRLDVLVNNAGFGIKATVEETSEEDWDRIMAVNLRGVYLGCKHAIPLMRARGGGVIVNNASVVAVVGIRDRAAYCASKGGVAALTRAMAIDHWGDGIRINAIGPGTVQTSFHDRLYAESPNPARLRRDMEARQVMNRLGEPEEIARAILFLAGEESSFCTGSLMLVDGGMSAW